MRDADGLLLRDATGADAETIAALHVESWRRTYRGLYSDAYLDGDVFAERAAVWVERFARPDPGASTIVAEAGGAMVGFVHTVLDADREWGSLLDNLHVAPDRKRSGIGATLMAAAAAVVGDRAATPVLHLWVLEENSGARAFYEALEGQQVGRATDHAPDGTKLVVLRYVWRDATHLCRTV